MEDIKPIPFKRILDPNEFSDGDIIKCIKGTIIKLYKIRAGEGTRGHYEYQDGEIKDDAGTIMGITFASCSQPDSAKGKRVTIMSTMTESFGKQGVKLEVSEYNQKEIKKLRITSSANISYDGGATGQQQQRPNGQAQQQPAMNVHPKVILQDLTKMHCAITDLVNEIYKEQPDAFKQGAVATIFIEAAKQGVAVDFAKRYSQMIIPPAPADPKNWSECVVPKGSNIGKRLQEVSDEDLLKLHGWLADTDSKTNFAKCVYQAALDRNVLPVHQDETGAEENLEELPDIPFSGEAHEYLIKNMLQVRTLKAA
jgi:hypothetical protein